MFTFPEDMTSLSIEELRTLQTQAREALSELIEAAGATPTVEQADRAEYLDTGLSGVAERMTALSAASDRFAGVRDRFTAEDQATDENSTEENADENSTDDNSTEENSDDENTTDENADENADENSAGDSADANSGRSDQFSQRRRGNRPELPGFRQGQRLTMVASADIPDVSTGSSVDTMSQVAQMVLAKSGGFPVVDGDGGRPDYHSFGVVNIHKNFPDDLKIKSTDSQQRIDEVLQRAIDQSRLPGGNLVASAGWCSPSEVAYSLCEGETFEGGISLPEVDLPRGGMKYTMGPDWSDITGQGEFSMTEAVAIAGTYTKPSFEIPCTTWVEARLDAAGLFVKVPLLLDSTYPELVARWLRGLNTSHQHIMNGRYIAAVAAALGTAQTYPLMDMGSASTSLFDIIALVAERERSIRKWSFKQALEIILPHWVLEALRADISNRTGRPSSSVKDAEIMAMFAERRYAPQWVLDYQELVASTRAYPATFDALIYKAGTFVRGGHDVIKLGTTYDAASLASNIYTALFMEEGWNVMRMCQGGVKVTVPVCIAGRQGIANVAACGSV